MDTDDDAFLYGEDSATAPVPPSAPSQAINADTKTMSVAPTLPEANQETVKEIGQSAEQAAGGLHHRREC